ncbi:MAG: hypothetical protein M1371_10370 [Actinobacteria bacterium]|nr:hypothetical protein [Actinomycetota bacterium]
MSVLKEEVNLNIKTITDIEEGLETGFTLDRLSQEAIRAVLLNPDLFIFCRTHGGIKVFLAYDKSIFIAKGY